MRYNLDLDADSLYIELQDVPPVSQVQLPSGVVVDVDEEMRVVGVEVLRVSVGWSAMEVIQRFPMSVDDATGLGFLASMASPGRRFPGSDDFIAQSVSDIEADVEYERVPA